MFNWMTDSMIVALHPYWNILYNIGWCMQWNLWTVNILYPVLRIVNCTANSTSRPSIFVLYQTQASCQITFPFFILISVCSVFMSLSILQFVSAWGDAHTSLNFLSTHSTLSSTLLQHLTFCCMAGAHHPPSNLHVNKLALHHHTTVLFGTID